MKAMFLFVCILCAAALSLLAALYATGRMTPKEEKDEVNLLPAEWRATVFPEQSRAVEDLLKELNARKEELDRKEAQLTEQAAKVRQEEITLIRIRDELTSAEEALKTYFKEQDAIEQVNMRKLAEFYSKMDPQNAATLLSELEPEQASRVLVLLQDRQAGAIMDAAVTLGPRGIERAVAWSELIRKQKNEKAKKPVPTEDNK